MSAKRKLSSVILLVVWAACFEAKDIPPAAGGESNFLQACEQSCAEGLECVCGVCTRSCTSDRTCVSLASNAICLGTDAIGDTRVCEQKERSDSPRVCDARCSDDRECRDGLTCRGGLCREAPKVSTGSNAGTGATQDGGPTSEPMLDPNAPVVMLLVDTSGSLSDMPGCSCTSETDCTNCTPDCGSNEQNRWFTVLAALGGSYASFGCQTLERTADNGATYDEGYTVPNYVLAPAATQRGDGLIDGFGTRIQFGLATFDAESTYRGATDLLARMDFDFAQSGGVNGMFSYAGGTQDAPRQRPDGTTVGRAFYPGCEFPLFVDTGIRSASATEGALVLPGRDLSPSVRSQQLRDQVRRARPYGGTPTAAALDDLYFFFTEDPSGVALPSTQKRHVVLITDGRPDRDMRDLGCACTGDACGVAPNQLSCPYPTAAEAALHLHCGFGTAACAGPIEALHVVGLSVSDTVDRAELDSIAASGGSGQARFASDQPELRAALRSVFEAILKQ
jgi:hypothetical protein